MPADRRYLESDSLRPFTRRRPTRWLAAVFFEWAIIGTLMWVCVATGFWPLWALSVFIIGTRQHALGIMAHESVHSLVSKRRRLNDALGNLLTAYPLTYPVEAYRYGHLKHHRLLDTPDDPERVTIDQYPDEWTFPLPKRRALWLLVRDALGVRQFAVRHLVKYIWQLPDGRWWPHAVRVAAWHAAVIALAMATGYLHVYLVLWVVPLLTVALMCFRIRTVAEHSGIYEGERRFLRADVDTVGTTRTITGARTLQHLFGPYNMCYHVEHHLYPAVPVFDLRRLHGRLLEDDEYRVRCHRTAGYRELLDELTTPSNVATAAAPTGS